MHPSFDFWGDDVLLKKWSVVVVIPYSSPHRVLVVQSHILLPPHPMILRGYCWNIGGIARTVYHTPTGCKGFFLFCRVTQIKKRNCKTQIMIKYNMPHTKGVDVLERYREQYCDELILCMHRCIIYNNNKKKFHYARPELKTKTSTI